MIEIISARFLSDPEFNVSVNNITIQLSHHQGLIEIEENSITLSNGVKFEIIVIDSTKTARKAQQHGLAFWVGGRLVGKPDWNINDVSFLDGRTKQAKRYTIVLKTEDLIPGDDILPDWRGFTQSLRVKSTMSELKVHISKLLSHIMSEHIDEVREDIIHENLEQFYDLSIQAKREVSAFIEEVTKNQPLIKEEILQTAVDAYVNVEKTRRGGELLLLLNDMDDESLEQLTELLRNWDVKDIALVMDEIDRRMSVIKAIQRLHDDPSADELHTLHPLILHSRWLFGAEFDSHMFTSNETLNTVFNKLFKDKEIDGSYVSDSRRRPDIVVLNHSSLRAICTDRSDNNSGVMKPDQVLIIEIKRGAYPIGLGEVTQGMRYMIQIRKSGVLHNSATIKVFVVGASIGDDASSEPTTQGPDVLHVATYAQLIDTALTKLLRLQEHLRNHYDKIGDESLVEKALRTSMVQMKYQPPSELEKSI